MATQSGDEGIRGGRSLASPIMNQSSTHVPVLPLGGFIVVIVGLAAGFVGGTFSGLGFTALISGVIAASIAYASYGHEVRSALVRSLYFGVFFLIVGTVIVLSTGIPWLAAIAMGLFAFAGSVLTTTSPLGLTAALLSSTAYMILAGFSLLFMRDQGVNIPLMILALAIGVVAGVLISTLFSFALSRLRLSKEGLPTHRIALGVIWATAATAITEFRRAPRDGVRRALALGVAMYIFQAVPSHDGFLLIITTAIVLPVYGRVPLMTVGSRLLWSFMAIGIALILPFVVPQPFVSLVALLVIAYALATALRSTTNSLAASCIGFLLLIGAPGAEIGIYAGWRLIDVAGGFLIAWLAGYVLWPRQPLLITPIPSDLHVECERVQPTLRSSV